MRYAFHPGALEEYIGAISYYDDINPQLSGAFVSAIEAGIDNILTHPEAWQMIEDGVRRHLVKRFPYGIYYCVEDDCIMIYAVMHLSRHPDYWKDRIRH